MPSDVFSPPSAPVDREEKLAELVADYGHILSSYGATSPQAAEFLRRYQDEPELGELAGTASRLKKVASEREKAIKARQRKAWWNLVLSSAALGLGLAGAAAVTGYSYRQAGRLTQENQALVLKAENASVQAKEASKQVLRFGSNEYAKLADSADEHIPVSGQWSKEQLALLKDIESVAKVLPPEKNAADWSEPELYAWAKAPFVAWDQTGSADPTQLEEANRRLDFLIQRYPRYGKAYALKAQVVQRLDGDRAQVIELYRRAIENDPQLAHVYNNLAWLLKDRDEENDLQEAVRLADKGIDVAKQNLKKQRRELLPPHYDTAATARERLASHYEKRGQPDKAAKLLEEAEALRRERKDLLESR
jgi:tetratricopeptide (TPR) repeat protein